MTKCRLLLVSKITGLIAFLTIVCSGMPRDAGAEDRSEPSRIKAVANVIAHSLWGVIPNAPQYKRELGPELIRGSAVAVSDTDLLVRCDALSGSARIGVVRHNKFRIAGIVATDANNEICVLNAPDAPLRAASWYRSSAGVTVGESVYAIVNRTAADITLIKGQVTAVHGAEPILATDLVLPRGMASAIVFDQDGNLLGLAGYAGNKTSLVAPITTTVAPALQRRRQQAVQSSTSGFAGDDGSEQDTSMNTAGAAPPQPATTLHVSLVAGKGSRPVLQLGERLETHLRVSADAYVYCFHMDSDGRISRVFPNRFQPDALVPAKLGVMLPGHDAGFELVAEVPNSREELRCFAAERDPGPSLPAVLVSIDLVPLPRVTMTEVTMAFRRIGTGAADVTLPILVAGTTQVAALSQHP